MTQDHFPLPVRLGQAVLDALRDCAEANTDILIMCDGRTLSILPANGRTDERRVVMTRQEVMLHRLDACV